MTTQSQKHLLGLVGKSDCKMCHKMWSEDCRSVHRRGSREFVDDPSKMPYSSAENPSPHLVWVYFTPVSSNLVTESSFLYFFTLIQVS